MPVSLWDKGVAMDPRIRAFTVGEDAWLDRELLYWDLAGTAAHVRMLGAIGALGEGEAPKALAALAALRSEWGAGKFTLDPAHEDAHTAIEVALTERLGDLGKKIHLGRSRNDQVALAMRLKVRADALELSDRLASYIESLFAFAEKWGAEPMPGHTHLQAAMPSTWGMWAHAHIEAGLESLRALQHLYAELNRSPLGAAAGFGSPVPVDREATAEALGFDAPLCSVVDGIASRARLEGRLLCEIAFIGAGLEKFAWDLSLFLTREFGYVKLDESFRTGSSIMPQKQNPDVVELLRGRAARLRGTRDEHEWVAAKLPSNYHRDHQLLKAPLFRGVGEAKELLEVAAMLPAHLSVDVARVGGAMTADLDAARVASERALEGQTFRDSYREVARSIPMEGASRGVPEHVLRESRAGLVDAGMEWGLLRAWARNTRAALDRSLEKVFTL